MDSTIVISVRNVYGLLKAYPDNEQAHRLARLVGSKTLTPATLASAMDMGFTVKGAIGRVFTRADLSVFNT
jgi:hypothetical protein